MDATARVHRGTRWRGGVADSGAGAAGWQAADDRIPRTGFGFGHEFMDRRALAAGLPTIFENRQAVEAGGFMSYGVNETEGAHRAAAFVDKILKGAKPGDLPIEFATTIELVVNLKTAKALGLTLPPALLARADEVIE